MDKKEKTILWRVYWVQSEITIITLKWLVYKLSMDLLFDLWLYGLCVVYILTIKGTHNKFNLRIQLLSVCRTHKRKVIITVFLLVFPLYLTVAAVTIALYRTLKSIALMYFFLLFPFFSCFYKFVLPFFIILMLLTCIWASKGIYLLSPLLYNHLSGNDGLCSLPKKDCTGLQLWLCLTEFY